MMSMKQWVVGLSILVCSALYADIPEKLIVIVVPSYNNSQWYQLNIASIIQQQYSNYIVLYYDDCSTDGTAQLVENFILNYQRLIGLIGIKYEHISIIKNGNRLGSLANTYQAIHNCPDNAIIMILDGDDWLKDNQVLRKINKVYQDPNVWLTYGQYETYPRGKLGTCKDVPHEVIVANAFRDQPWVTTHLRTFYAKLFKQIKKEDLYYNNDFFRVTGDMAYMFPLVELAGTHSRFISEVLYTYNISNPLSDYITNTEAQVALEKVIRSKTRYLPLPTLSLLRS